ncbi:MAG: hypothetical protein WC799_20505 [Desulfobacteraceae bacterium]|jgi:hypothetical protein
MKWWIRPPPSYRCSQSLVNKIHPLGGLAVATHIDKSAYSITNFMKKIVISTCGHAKNEDVMVGVHY